MGFDFFAIWKFPSDDIAKTFETMVAGAGWHNYFEQQNMKGNPATPQEVIGALISM
jgi:preprotein translocase subunit Sec61beta